MLDEVMSVLEGHHQYSKGETYTETHLYRLRKLLPHVDVISYVLRNWSPDLDQRQFALEMLRLEYLRRDEPEIPFITQEGLVNNICYLLDQFEDFGEFPLEVLVPLELEYPNARIAEMLTGTHAHESGEAIVAEIYRRQADPEPSTPDQ